MNLRRQKPQGGGRFLLLESALARCLYWGSVDVLNERLLR